jgi:membrane protease YdiL (CAAX protease family)
VLLAYAAGLVLTITACAAFVSLVARARAGPGNDVAAAERDFALSASGLSGCALIEGLVQLGVAVTAARLERGEGPGLGLGRRRVPLLAWLAAIVGLAGVSMAAGGACELAGARGVVDIAADAFRHPGPASLAATLVTVGVVPATGEEALFRGYVQPRLVEVAGRWPAIVATSAAFGLLHGEVAQGAAAFAAGLFLGWSADRTGSLRPVIAAHAANNATFILTTAAGLAVPPVAAIPLGTAACVGACVVLARRTGSIPRAAP